MVAPVSGNNYYYSSGTPINSREFDVQTARMRQLRTIYGNDLDFKSSLFMSGVDGDAVLQNIENDIEGFGGDGISGNTLSWNRYITSQANKNDVVFQSANGGSYYNINFDQDRVYQMSEQQFAWQLGAFGNLSTKPYDLAVFGQDTAQFVDYKFTGGGASSAMIDLSVANNVRWGNNVSYVTQYFNPLRADFNPYSQGEPGFANLMIKQMMDNGSQWLSSEEKGLLAANSNDASKYYSTLLGLVITNFDQSNDLYSWYI